MKTREEIKKTMAENAKIIKETDEFIATAKLSSLDKPATTKRLKEREILQMENKIWFDNLRRVIYSDVIPTITEVFNKYTGKSYGPKTKEKIYSEIKERTNCSVYVESHYKSSALHISPLNDEGYTDFNFSYRDFVAYTSYQKIIVNESNKLERIEVSDLRLGDCLEYVEDPREQATEIIEVLKPNVMELSKTLDLAVNELNAKLPSGVSHVSTSISNMRW